MGKQQVDLGRPTPKSLDPGYVRHGFLVPKLVQNLQVELALVHQKGQGPNIALLLAGQSNRTQFVITHGQQPCGFKRLASLFQAPPYGSGCSQGDLLRHDNPQQGGKPGRAIAQGRTARFLQATGHVRIRLGQALQGQSQRGFILYLQVRHATGLYTLAEAMSALMSEVTRFAPSPTGRLHLGHAYAALFAAEQAGPNGRFLIRMEDIDRSRCRSEYETAILEDLAWLGLSWSPPVERQSAHLDDHRQALDRLREADLLYPCFCTRREISDEVARSERAPHGPEGPLYPGTCRHLSRQERHDRMEEGLSYAWRLDTAEALKRMAGLTWMDRHAGKQIARPELLGDVVLARKDISTSYHLSVVVDDARQGITLVTRGEDLFMASHLHRLLQALLDLPVPEWRHHRLVNDSQGQRLAKRHDSLSLESLRQAGETPQEIRRRLGFAAS